MRRTILVLTAAALMAALVAASALSGFAQVGGPGPSSGDEQYGPFQAPESDTSEDDGEDEDPFCAPEWLREWYQWWGPEGGWWYFWWFKWCHNEEDGWFRWYNGWDWGPPVNH